MPKVTVITPNYNYARYLPRRLDSILGQTFRDFELIILDNASTDDSRRVIESYLHDPRVRAVFNERNNGSVFKQWNLGLRQATGEYVWIAEADDYAEPTFLETLVDRLDRHPKVGLAMCQSWVVDEEGRTCARYPEFLKSGYNDLVGDLSCWEDEFVADGRKFCLDHLYRCNEIVNASAVLFRRSALEAIAGAPEDMRLSGDHMTYVNILLDADIASVPAYLNYFRTHPATTRAQTPGDQALRELRAIQRRINDRFGLGEGDRYYRERLPATIWGMVAAERQPPRDLVPLRKWPGLIRRFARLGPRGFGQGLRLLGRERVADTARRLGISELARTLAGRAQAPAEGRSRASRPKVAFFATLMTDVRWGGSEELWYRTARLALERGHQVAVVSYGSSEPPPQLRELERLGARLLPLGHFTSWFHARSLYWRIRWKIERVTVWGALASWGPDVVCVSQGGTYDLVHHRVFTRFLERRGVPYVVLCHFNTEDAGGLAGEDERRAAISGFSRAHRVGFVAERNLRMTERQLGASLPNARVVRNPVNLGELRPVPYPASDVVTMANVARLHVPSKGQDLLLEALGQEPWRSRPWSLRLYGSGPDRPYLERLARYYGIAEKVEFRGHVGDIRSIWAENQLLVMPSRAEGTPLSIVEAMICARPSLVTDVGGNAEWVEEPATGFVASGPTARDLGAALGRAWEARDRWESIGRRAHEVALSRIDPHPDETVLAMLAEARESVVSGPNSSQ